MVKYADRVFYGKCLSAEEKLDPESGVIVREYRFQVLEALKGVNKKDVVVVRQLSQLGGGAPAIPGIPSYRKGQKLLLFLHGDSRLGLTSPVGMAQGTFRSQRLANGEVGFINGQRNRNLTRNLGTRSPAAAALTTEELKYLDSGKPVPLRMFRDVVGKLDALHHELGGVDK